MSFPLPQLYPFALAQKCITVKFEDYVQKMLFEPYPTCYVLRFADKDGTVGDTENIPGDAVNHASQSPHTLAAQYDNV